MFNGFLGNSPFEVFLSDVGCRIRVVDQHMVPRLVPGWLSAVAAIPPLVGLATRVEGDDDAAVGVFFVVEDSADGPFDLHRGESFA